MRFLIFGAGGIGAYYGARLHQADQQVTLIARGPHLQALKTQGLRVEHPDFRFQDRIPALSQEDLLRQYKAEDFDLLILTTKAGTTNSILKQLRAWLGQHHPLPILSLQNGIDNEQQIADIHGQDNTIGGLAVRIGGHITEPGVIEATGPAQVVMGAWPNAKTNTGLTDLMDQCTKVFNAADIPTTLSTDIQLELWKKLLINNGVNPLSALTGLDTRAITSHPVFSKTVYQLMQEAATAATADGIHVSESDLKAMYDLICAFDAIKTSMLVDREKGRPLELDAITGVVIKRSQRIGREAPVTTLIEALIKNSLDIQ